MERILGNILTFHNTFLEYDAESASLRHSFPQNGSLKFEFINNLLALKHQGRYLSPSSGRADFSDSACGFNFVDNRDGTFSIAIGNKFLSAQPGGVTMLQPWNKAYERFTLVGPDTSNERLKFLLPLLDYIGHRGSEPRILSCCWGHRPPRQEWLCTDIEEKPGIYHLDISKRFPIPDGIFDFIVCEHGTEHLDFDGLLNFCKECYRVLKLNGVLRIATPGLDNWIKYYVIDDDNTERITDTAFKNYFWPEKAPFLKTKAIVFNNMMRNWAHKLVLDFRTYKELLTHCKFASVTQEELHKSRWAPMNNAERRNDFYTTFETLVLEARK